MDIFTKRFFLLFLTVSVFTSGHLFAQQLPQINYQGVARKADGSPLMEQPITLRLTILDGSATGSNVYSETRQLSTNRFGLFNVVIGSSGSISKNGTIAAVNWATGNKFLQVEIDPKGGSNFVNMGSSQLQTVPYAIYATSAAPSGSAGGDLDGSFPNPVVTKLHGHAVSSVTPINGQVLKWNGTTWMPGEASSAAVSILGNLPITSSMQGGNSTISISKSDATTDGYLNKNDWHTFNSKANISYVDAAILVNSNVIAAETLRATTAESSKENVLNKSVDGTFTSNSDIKYPSEKATKTYVDAAIAGTSTSDATNTLKGKIQLAGDLAGTAALPIIADGKVTTSKILDGSITDSKIASGINAAKVGLSNADNTSDLLKPISVATQAALDLKASSTDLASKAPSSSPSFTGTVSGITATMVGLGNLENTADLNKPISTATQTALDTKASNTDLVLKAPLASPTFTGTVAGISKSMVGLGNVDNTTDLLKPISTATQTALDTKSSNTDLALKAPLASPTFTGTVAGISKSMVGLGNVDNTTDLLKPVSTATQTALDLKAPLASPTFTGTVAGISKSMVGLGDVENTTDLLKPISNATQTALDAKSSNTDLALKAPLASPTFTGTVAGIGKSMVGLGNVDNTTDLLKPISTATQTALDLKAPLASPTFTGTVAGISKSMVGLGDVDNTTDLLKPISTSTQTALDGKASNTDLALKAPLASPTFTGTVAGISKSMVALGNVDNTTDLLKPVSTATQTALDLKAPLASPTFTGTVAGISKSMVGLGNVDNTTDLLKPISTATQTALDAKSSNTDLALKAPLASPIFTGTVTGISKTMVGLGNVDNTTDLLKPISTATQTALDAKSSNSDVALKAPLASPTFTGTVALPSTTSIGSATAAEIGYVSGVTSSIQTQLNAKGSGTITGVSGTTNRITSSGGATPAIDIAATYVGQTSITTLGTVATGTWNADVIGTTKGGAGAVSGVLKANGSGTVSAATAGTDYSAGTQTLATGILKSTTSTGALSIAAAGTDYLTPNGSAAALTSFPTLNQNTTGNAATATLASTVITNANLTGSVTSSGNATTIASLPAISGASLTSLTASNLSSGTVPTARLGTGTADATTFLRGDNTWATVSSGTTLSNGTVAGQVYLTGATPFAVQSTPQTVSGDISITSAGVTTITNSATAGNNIVTAINAGSGAINAARLQSTVTTQGNTFNGASQLVQMNASTQLPAVSGVNLTALNAAQLGSGTVPIARLGSSGTADATTFLRGDNTWAALSYLPLGGGTLTGALTGTSATFSSDISANGISIGRGAGSNAANLVIGTSAFAGNTSGISNVIIGRQAAASSVSGSYNTIIGNNAVYYNEVSSGITALGALALHAEKGANNTAIGHEAGARGAIASTLTNSVFLGKSATAGAGTIDNAVAIGYGATVAASNNIQLGNTSITDVKTSGTITAGGISNTPILSKTIEAEAVGTLALTHSGSIIYSQHTSKPFFPEALPDGFSCVIVNYSGGTFTSNTLSTAKFHSKLSGAAGSTTFTIVPGGTVLVNVVTHGAVKRYYVSGDF